MLARRSGRVVRSGILFNPENRLPPKKRLPRKTVNVPPAPDRLRSLRECAQVWGVDRNLLNELLNEGEIAYLRPRKERKIPDSAMQAWIARTQIGKPE